MKLQLTQTASYPAIEYLPANAEVTYVAGKALVITSGKAALCGATTTPAYICYGPAEKGLVPAIRVNKGDTYAAQLSASGADLAVGNKVTLHTDSSKVTATTSSGVAEIVEFTTAAKASGDTVYIKF